MLLLKFTFLLALLFSENYPQKEEQFGQHDDLRKNIEILLSKAEQNLKTCTDSSFIFANEATKLSNQLNDTLLLLRCLRVEGKAKKGLYQYNDAIRIYENAVILSASIKDSSLLWGFKNDIGQVYYSKEDYVNALKFHVEALQVAEKHSLKENIAESNRNIAFILKSQQNFREAIIYLEKSLSVWRDLKNSLNITKTLINIAGNLAMIGEHDKSLEHLFQGEKYATEIKDTNLLSDIMISIANVYSFKSEIQKSEVFYLKGVKLKKALNDKKGLTTIYNNMSVFYLKNSNFKKGEEYAKLALEYAKETNLQNIQMASYKSLSFLYSKQKKFEIAYTFQNRFIKLNDSLFTIQKSEQLTKIKAKYEAEKKEQQIKILESENQLKEIEIRHRKLERNSFAGGVVIFILLSILILRAYREKRRINILLHNKNALIEQQKLDLSNNNQELNRVNSTKDRLFSIIAHDLRSPMSSMEGLSGIIRQLISAGKTEKLDAIALHIDQTVNRLNSLLDNLLNWSLSQINGLHVNAEVIYLKNVVLYSVDIQKLALNAKKITLNIDIDDEIKVYADQNMLRTVIRNLISNSIKFTPSNGFITISAFPDEKCVYVSVKDSGIGIAPEKLATIFEINGTKISAGTDGEKGTGLGLTLCRDFITLNNGEISMKSEIGKNTEVCFSLPILE
ncbi:MAG: sensor histidine kinase [Bacteroidales bacterium]|nr:MAG: sensor histidine kinase [Bacteroidales bacterium]